MTIFNSLLGRLASLVAATVPELCHLETISVDDPYSLICNDGSMVSVFKVLGAYRFYSTEQEIGILEDIGKRLKPILSENGYKVDFIFDIDASSAKEYVENAIGGMTNIANEMGYETVKLLHEEKKLLSTTVKPEMGFIVITTFMSSLDLLGKQESRKEQANRRRNAKLGPNDKSSNQNPLLESEQLKQNHKNIRDEIARVIEGWVGLSLMESTTVLSEIRALLYRETTQTSNWYPVLANTKGSMTPIMGCNVPGFQSYDIGHPSIVSQVLEDDIEKTSKSTVRYLNGNYYSCLERYLAGTELELVRKLFNAVRRSIPFRCTYTLVSGSKRIQSRYSTKRSVATFVAKTNPISKDILEGSDYVSSLVQNGETVVECYMTFVVWAKTADECEKNRRSLSSTLRGWGGERQRTSRYPDSVFLSSTPGFTRELPGRSLPTTIEEAIKSAPLVRPISPWNYGILMFVTPELKPWVINFDRTQDYILNLVSGAMGGGKSVLLGLLQKAITMIQGTKELPFIGTIDYGPSGSYANQNIRDMVPEHLKQYVADIRLSNKPESAYNILEPLFGNNRLSEPELNTAVSFIQRIVNGENGGVHAQLGECITAIIEAMVRDAIENPKPLDISLPEAKNINDAIKHPKVAEHLLDEKVISFKNARNALFLAALSKDLTSALRLKFFTLSKVAHRYMWPLVKEIQTFSTRQEIEAQIGAFYVGKAKLSEFIGAAVHLASERYSSILGNYPQTDYSDIRVINCDVRDICSNGSEHMKKAWFLLARGLVTRQFWYHTDDVIIYSDPVFLNYLKKVAEKRQTQIKYFGQDEYAQAQCDEYDLLIEKDTFIARKYLMYITLATQLHSGFPNRIVGLATNSFICNIPSIEIERYLMDQYNISKNEMEALRRFVGISGVADGKGRGFLYIGKINKSHTHIIQPIVSLMPPASVWALASDSEDVYVRHTIRNKISELGDKVLSFEDINFALGEVLGYPNIKDKIQKNKIEFDKSQAETVNECVNDVMKFIMRDKGLVNVDN